MTFNKLALITAFALGTTGILSAHTDYNGARPDGHAPISVMADHTHKEGEWMLSYRYMFMEMDGIRSGTNSLPTEQVFAENFTVSPERMTMEMHMFGIMYAPSDEITLMAMIPYISLEMDHSIFSGAAPLLALNGGSSQFTTRSEGFGDLKLAALINTWRNKTTRSHLTLGFSLPTGSIGEQDEVPGPGGRLQRTLPAAMQLGSGTVDFTPSFTITQQWSQGSWGTQANSVIRTGENHHGYRLGHQFGIQSWLARNITEAVGFNFGGFYNYTGELHGTQTDVALNPPFAPTRNTVTTAFGQNYGGHQAGILFGCNLYVPTGNLKGNRLAIDCRVPLYRDLNGLQLETDYTVTLGWQYAW